MDILKEITLTYAYFHKNKTCHNNLIMDNIIVTKENKIKFHGLEKCRSNN